MNDFEKLADRIPEPPHGGLAAPQGLEPRRACFSGSRGFKNLELVDRVVAVLPPNTVVVHGGAHGVDQRAAARAEALGYSCDVFIPQWKLYGKRAGPLRNAEMLATVDVLYAFWDRTSRGTYSTIMIANAMKLPMMVVFEDGTDVTALDRR